ncbi:GDSL lipase/esterase [Jimgerdemannia flammicorona]|uniref:GDSL lipase/esterase n=1 Tax=Jimgerdemannia flammicorona TaxID=994334 RepID=A0A433DHR2_9FUNG|nr:GDSL lipase/esterase [Jimgerdemannia flammicorona]
MLSLYKSLFLVAALCTVTGGSPIPSSSLHFKRIVVFGDSYSDNGNFYSMTEGGYPKPPYAKRFSNGPVWNEYLVNVTGWELENYAFGGATTDNSVINGLTGPRNVSAPGIAQQIANKYFPTLTDAKLATIDSSTLFVLWANGNDFSDDNFALANQVVDRLTASIDSIRNRIPTAKHFLTFALSGLGDIPLLAGKNQTSITASAVRTYAKALSGEFNFLYRVAVEKYQVEHEGVKISLFPTDQLFEYLVTPEGMQAAKITEVRDGCVDYYYKDGEAYFTRICDNPQDYLYFDNYHPTTTIHSHISAAVLSFLEHEYST